MADQIGKTIELFLSEKSPSDLSHKLHSDTVQVSLRSFYAILLGAVEPIGDGKLGFQSWSASEVQSVATAAKIIVSASRSLSAGLVDPIVLAIVDKCVDFATCYLERSFSDAGGMRMQNSMLRLLEIALVHALVEEVDMPHLYAINTIIESLPVVTVRQECMDLETHIKCHLQGMNCLREVKLVDSVLITLAPDRLQPDSQATQIAEFAFCQDSNIVSLAQHLAVVHMRCIHRLLLVCKNIVQMDLLLEDQREDLNFHSRLSFGLRALKLLMSVTKDKPCVAYEADLLQAVCSFVDTLPNLFKFGFDLLNHDAASSNETSLDCLLLLLLEEFLQLVQVVFCDGIIFHNVQTCIIASLLDILDTQIWRYDKSADVLKAPLIYSPRVVLYLLKLVGNVKNWTSQIHIWEEKLDMDPTDWSDFTTASDAPFCHVHSEKVSLLKTYTCEEHLKLMLPPSKQWVDNMMHLAVFLHTEGIKSKAKGDRSRSGCVKIGGASDTESAVSHEDEALFGDLFCEAGRPVALADGSEQASVAVSSISTCSNKFIQAATELISFLKVYIFSPEWHSTIYEDARNKLRESHIDLLLSILTCQVCSPDEKAIEGCMTSQSRVGHINDVCFELLHSLLVHHALSSSLEEHLVDEILNVDSGAFAYNDHTLILLAHALVCKVGPVGSQLRAKIYGGYVHFILEKAKLICLQCPGSMKEFLPTLPNILHIEILFMAFHLSSDSEKQTFAAFILSSFKEVDVPRNGCSSLQLSCWSLLVSRLGLALRHIIAYSSTFPSWLLLRLRSRLRETPPRSSLLHSASDTLLSWVAVMGRNVTCEGVKESVGVSNLLHHLIDVSAVSGSVTSVFRDDQAFRRLGLNWFEVCDSFSFILGFWKGKKACTMEDFLLERYIFKIFWDTLGIGTTFQEPLSFDADLKKFDLANVKSFFHFGRILSSNRQDVSKLVMNILKQLEPLDMSYCTDEQGWDLLRSGAWLSLVLSLLHAGVWGFAVNNAIHGVEHFWTEQTPKDVEFLALAGSLVASLFQRNQVAWLLKVLSSLLRKSLQALQEAFTSIIDRSRCYRGRFSPVLLLKHTGFQKCMRIELLDKCGSSLSVLETIYSLPLKLDELVRKEDSGSTARVFLTSLLHGFPSHTATSSAVLISCILNIKGIICTLDGFLKVKEAGENILVEKEVLQELLESVVTIKSDNIFQHIHDKCEAIYSNLSVFVPTILDYGCLFVMKHIEGFLTDLSTIDVTGTDTHETIIMSAVDFMEGLRRDPSKAGIFKYYVGAVDAPEEYKSLCGGEHGNLLVLLDMLGICYSEAVNVKVLNFFVDLLAGELCPELKVKIQKKFLDMELPGLSMWLKRMLLGCAEDASEGLASAKGSSVSVRESAIKFILCMMSPLSASESKNLQSRFVEALITSLDDAFMLYDVQTAKAYFNFIVQLSNGESSMKQLLKRIFVLIEKLGAIEDKLLLLKFLFGFLGAVLSACGVSSNVIDKCSGKMWFTHSCRPGSSASRSVSSRKNSELLVLPANQGTGSTSLDCDATSVDEDEDDGTSDGELASVEKDDEDDSSSERALASKVCTFTSSGSNFMEQHWYFCYTCDLTVSKGCCSVCAKVCHRGHRVVYSRSSRFFCDCGAGGVRGSSCQCLKPRKFTGSSTAVPSRGTSSFPTVLSFPDDGDQTPDSGSEQDDDIYMDAENSFKISVPNEVQDMISSILLEIDVENRVLELCNKLLPVVISRRDSSLSKDKKVVLGEDKVLSYSIDLLHIKKAYKSGSLDLKIKTDYSNSKDLKSHLTSGSLIKSLLSINTRGRLAAGEGDKVTIFDADQLIGQPTVSPVTADKTNVKPLSKNVIRFEIVHLMFNPVAESYLAVAGFEDCQVLTINSRGEVTDRLAVELALQGGYIRRVDWVPGSQVQLMVVANMFVKIYDLSQDNISPVHYFTLQDDFIVDAALVIAPQGRLFLLVLSDAGCLYRLELSIGGEVGARPLTEIIQVQGKDKLLKGRSLHFSSLYRLLFISYQDGTTFISRLNASATSLTEISALYENEHNDKFTHAGLHHWKELISGSGFFVCFSSIKPNAVFAASLGPHEVFVHNIRSSGGSTAPLVGIAAYRPLSKDKAQCLVLHDDGSLHIFSQAPLGGDNGANFPSDRAKKLGSGILNNRAYAGGNPEFPLDFFEKTVCITADVKLSGDAIRSSDSEGAKQSLASDEGFLESPSPAGFKIIVSNSNPDIVMVGFRIQVGNSSVSHIPSDITIFQRVIKLDEGMRSWYDIPFAVAESLLADEEFTISVGPSFSGSALPRIDSLEVYGRSKDEFGWKEKMDAVLDMEANALGASPGVAGARKKGRLLQTASVQEQVVTDGLKLLARYYSLCKFDCTDLDKVKVELSDLKCGKVLEMIFETDREPLLQSAACYVLQAVFPKREVYYQVKDTMRLLGVVSSCPALVSRLGAGGATAAWVIQEFTAQVRAVSKIALQRRTNMARFIENHGTRLVDSLMQVLWGILDLEQPDTQTINNIVIPSVELIYNYAECLAFNGTDVAGHSVKPAVLLLKKLLFAPYEAVQTSSSLAISSRLLQVPFPKQTMLTADDPLETTMSAPVNPDATGASGGNTQIMGEEDSTTSSVQYCCDGCSTVPILRRRWHCNVCPDFDLCEACYEVMDADRLPPPHSRDHSMSAIPIEVDSIGGDGNEIHFSMDELSEPNILQVASDINVQNSPPSVHHLEQSEASGEFPPVNDQRIVSISASKRIVNSLLLCELVAELRGWMEMTSGCRAVPVMQLFYRLSSAVGGPFMDSSKPENLDLENFVKWFLDEINLGKPFSAKARSSFGEVVILVFMFFTLMLRNWHQPGSESSLQKSSDNPDKPVVQIPFSTSSTMPSIDDQEKEEFISQLVRACSLLRQQVFVNYLMDILQQLVHVFKSPPANLETNHALNPGTGCGALLTIRKGLPAGNFSPYFSDSYAKSHRSDLFMDYHRLLLENTFRLVYSLIRPEKQDKLLEKDKHEKSVYKSSSSKDLKLEGYQDVLCSYINNPHTTFVRRYARRLFLHICGSKTLYYNVRDSWQLSNEVKKLYRLVDKTGGVQNPVSYERSVKLIKCLSAMSEVAGARPRNWQKYCSKHGDVLSFLMDGIFNFGEESVLLTLKLLNLAFYTGKDMAHSSQKIETGDAGTNSNKAGVQLEAKKRKQSEDGNENGSEKAFLDMEQAVEIFSDKDASILRHFVDSFLLEWNSTAVRVEAKCVIYGIWHHGKQSFKETILKVLLEKVKYLPSYGQNIVEYTELLVWLLGKVPENPKQQDSELVNRCLTPEVIKCIFDTLHSQNELLANHPNSRIYNTLSGLVEFDGYYLESEPCVTCSCPEVPYTKMKLESLKSETKFTDNRIIVKCTGSYTIQTVTMNVHDARKSKSVKVLNLYYNNKPVSDLSELKNNWSLWKRAKSCHLAFNQTELKVEFPIPITACNFMIELDSFYENLQASSLESLQCPRCSRSVTDKHGICSNCHENAYQCRQCRNINYENLDSFLCNECGYSKYGRFEFNFMAKPSFLFDNMENDDDMKKGLLAIESESENAHRRYQQLLGLKKPLLKLVSSIGENEIDSQHKDSVQQMMVSMSGPSCKINRKIALLGVLYGEKCKAAFDSVSKSVQTLQGLRRVLMSYLHQKHAESAVTPSVFSIPRSPNNCYGCATTFVTQCLELLQILSKHPPCKKQLVSAGILSELFENNIHQGPRAARVQARAVLCAFSEGDANAVAELNSLIQKKVMYCLEHHRSIDIAIATCEELLLLSETCAMADEFWEARLRVAFQLLFSSIKLGARHPAISEHVILPCLRIVSQACTLPKPDAADKDHGMGKPTSIQQPQEDNITSQLSLSNVGNGNKSPSEISEKHWDSSRKTCDMQLLSYSEWEKGASYIDFVRRQYKVSQAVKAAVPRYRRDPQRLDYLALKYALRWRRCASRRVAKSSFSGFELGSWVSELVLSACSQSIRAETSSLVSLLCSQSSSRKFQLLNLLIGLLPATLSAGESAAEYFDLLFRMIETEDARLFLAAKGSLTTICKLIGKEVNNVESQERSLHVDISQGFILHKLIELLSKFLEVSNIRFRFIRDELLSEVLEALLVIRGLIVQKTKLIGDCNKLLKDLLDSLLLESTENKRHFIRACVSSLQNHSGEKKGRTTMFILEQLCNIICPSKPEPVYLLVLNKAHTQEEFIRGSMTKNPYSSTEIGPLMRDVKNKICHQLDLLGLLEDDYGMELLVAGNIISLDLSISQVYEQVWKKSHSQASSTLGTSGGFTTAKDSPPMTVTYRLQGLDGEATEPMIKELEEEREESQDPEIEFAIAGAVRECGGLEIILSMIQRLRDDELKSNQEELDSVLNLLMHCCKIRENRRALLCLGALGLLLETVRRAFSVDAMEPAEGILLIVESLTMEANESDIGITQSVLTVADEETRAGEQAKKIVLMFLERLCHPSGLKKSNKQQRNNEMVARILPYLTYGQPAAMEALILHFDPYLQDWDGFDLVQKRHMENPKDDILAQQAAKQWFAVENFVRVSESLKTSSCGDRLKDIILDKGITSVAVRHLKESFACAGQVGFKSSAEWTLGLKEPSIPLILSMLRGLSKGHLPTQRCIDEGGILLLLHALEGVPGENEIGARAENLLDTLSGKEGQGNGFLGEKVHMLRNATRDEMRRRALRKRVELLQGLGMRQEISSDGGERIVVSKPAIEGLEDMEEEEDGLACMVCREGYTLRPNDMLGVYSYSKRVNLVAGTSGNSRGECVYTTVSHFNIIHFQCHQEAKRADAALKNPKKEWEGATLRNNETLCNCIFPLKGPSVPLAQYVRCVDQYWDNLNALGRADGSRLRLLTYDIVLMLARFATGACFNADCKGGGRESNSRFLPFMVQMACHLLEQGGSNQRKTMAKSISSYLGSVSPPDAKPSAQSGTRSSAVTEETVQFMMVNSLLSESYEDWLQHRRVFLQRGIYHAYMQHAHGRVTPLRFSDPTAVVRSESSSPESSENNLFHIILPMLVYTGLIEQLQRFFKVDKSSNLPRNRVEGTSDVVEGDEGNGGLERWEIVMKERLLNVKEMVGFSKELLSWLEDMTSSSDFQEAFDVLGALGDVLSGSFNSCENYVQDAIGLGRS